MSSDRLDQRHRQVLRAVIAEYVETAQPVGSRSIARHHMRGLSPATIRNVMADLEDMGYLAQPHTSAGRLPTDKAYRFYVDALERVPWTATPGPRASSAGRPPAAEQVICEAPSRLSQVTSMTGMLLAPPLRHTGLDRIELVPLSDGRALAVIVTDTGWITTRAVVPEPRQTADDLRELGRALSRRYRGWTFQAIVDDIAVSAETLDPLWTKHRAVGDQLVSLLRDRTLYISGATNLLNQRDFGDMVAVRNLLKAFEDKARLVDLLTRMAQERGIQVVIGVENPVTEMQECSLVTSTYTYRDQVLGVLGVVGPRRMLYSDVISLVDEAARRVSDSLARITEEPLYFPS
jgi:heat-inducible transcriptional repressor